MQGCSSNLCMLWTPGGPKTLLGLTPRTSQCLEWCIQVCISIKILGDIAGLGTTLEIISTSSMWLQKNQAY